MRWKKKEPKIPYNHADDILEKLAKINGISDLHTFLHPEVSSMHSPYMMDHIEEARNKIIDTLENKRKISIFADVDGELSLS